MAALVFEWYGLSCFKLTVKHDVGEVTLLTDPLGPDAGVKMPRGAAADIVVVSRPDPKGKVRELVGGKPFFVTHPGEYEAKGVFVYGFPAEPADGKAGKEAGWTVYAIEAADVSIGFLGSVPRPPSDAALSKLSEVDILLLPVGGHDAAPNAGQAVEILTRLEPRIVIPMMYKAPGVTLTLDPVEKFVKESGLAPEKTERLKLAKKDLPQEDTKLYVFSL